MGFLAWFRAFSRAPLPSEAKDDEERARATLRLAIERVMVAILVALCFFILANRVAGAAKIRDLPNENEELVQSAQRLQALGPNLPTDRAAAILTLGAFVVAAVLALPALPIVIFLAWRRKRAGFVRPDPMKQPPPWGVLLFIGLLATTYTIQSLIAPPFEPPRIIIEEGGGDAKGRTIELLPGAAALFGPKDVEPPKDGAVVPVAGATSVRARVEFRAWKVWLVVEPSVASAPKAFVESDPVEGRRRVKTGAKIRIGDVLARVEEPQSRFDARSVLGTLVMGTFLVAAIAVLVVAARGGSASMLGLKLEGAHREAARGVGLVLIALPWVWTAKFVNMLALKAVGLPDEAHPLAEEVLMKADASAIVAIFVAACIAAPIHEEILFRGVLLRALRRPLALVPAIVVMSLCFGVLHPLGTVIPVGALGALLGTIFVTSSRGSLVGSIAAHATFNGTSLGLALLVRKALLD